MGLFDNFPYTNFHEINLDWLIDVIKKIDKKTDDFAVTNQFKIGGVWSIQKSYEKYTIVTTATNAYISKDAVPYGVNITNEEYWIDIGALDPRIVNIQADVNSMESAIGVHTQEIKELFERENRAVIMIGDSYGTTNGNLHDTLSTTLPQATQAFLHVPNDRFFSAFTNGAGFANGVLLSELQGIGVSAPDRITDIYVVGGWNDELTRPGVDETSVRNGMQRFADYCRNTFKLAKLHLVFVSAGPYHTNIFYDFNLQKTWRIYNSAGEYGFNVNNSACYTLYNSALMLPYDGIHPNQSGVYALAKNLASIIVSDTCYYQHIVVSDSSTFGAYPGTTNNASTTGFKMLQRVTPAGVDYNFNVDSGALLINFTTPLSTNLNNGYIPIMTYNPQTIIGTVSNEIVSPVTITIGTDTEVITLAAQFSIHNTDIGVVLPYVPVVGLQPKPVNIQYILIGNSAGFTDCRYSN